MSRTRMLDRSSVPKIDLEPLFRGQRGLATRQQLLVAGLDDEAIRQQLRGSRWQRVLPGMYADVTGLLTVEQRRVAADLYTSSAGQLTGVAALAWYGFRHLPTDPLIHVLVPHTLRRASRLFLRIERTRRLDQNPRLGNGYTVCSVARSVADACRWQAELTDVRAIVAESVQRRLTTVAALDTELASAATSRTALLRRAVTEIGSGAHSAPEVDLQTTLEPSRLLPTILWNPQLVTVDGTPLPSPDGWIDDVGIAIECDSREYHLNPEGWQKTMWRHNLLSSYGALVLHFTPSELRGRRPSVRRTVERAYAERQSSGATATIRVRKDDGSTAPAD